MTTEEDNFRDALFEASLVSIFPSVPFFCMVMFESTEKQSDQLHALLHFFFSERDFLISPSLKCRERTLVLLVTLNLQGCKGPIIYRMTPYNSLTKSSVNTVPLYCTMVSRLSFKVLANSKLAILGPVSHLQFQSFNILSSGRFSNDRP